MCSEWPQKRTCTVVEKSSARPPTKTLHTGKLRNMTQFNDSLSFFIAYTFTVFDAGLALKTQGSLVKGLMPFFAGVAGFFFSFMLSIPANLKFPFFLIWSHATAISASTTPFACLVFKPLVSATDARTAVCVMAPPFMAARAFIAFIAGAIVKEDCAGAN